MTVPAGSSSPIPAVIFCHAPTSSLQIAGLSLTDRLVVAVHRGGASPITLVANGAAPNLQRARALGVPLRIQPRPPDHPGPVLLAESNLLVQDRDVRRCLASAGRLLSDQNEPLPVGVANAVHPRVDLTLEDSQAIAAEGVARRIEDPAAAKAAEAELWRRLTSSSDGLVDRVFNRPCGRVLSKVLIHTSVSPNAVSLTSILIGVAAGFGFAIGTAPASIVAAILFQISAIIDCVDGDLARVLFKESRFGKWLDLAGDQVVHAAVFAGIALGVVRAHADPWAPWLGLSAVVGALISFAVVVRGMRRCSNGNGRLQQWLDAATNRDFSVLVLALALCQQLRLFLWLAGIGSHLFWLALLSLQLRNRPDGALVK